jgi:hypothetical protein
MAPVYSMTGARIRSRRGKLWRAALSALVLAVAVQSVTITPSLRLRYLGSSGIPIEGLSVVSVWQLRAGTPAGSLGSGVIRVFHARTNREGYVRIGAAVMLHPPVVPFSLQYRDVEYLPMVFADDARYGAVIAASGLRPQPGRTSRSVLSFQQAGLDGETLRMTQPTGDQIDSGSREMVRQQIQQAHFACRASWFCREVES